MKCSAHPKTEWIEIKGYHGYYCKGCMEDAASEKVTNITYYYPEMPVACKLPAHLAPATR